MADIEDIEDLHGDDGDGAEALVTRAAPPARVSRRPRAQGPAPVADQLAAGTTQQQQQQHQQQGSQQGDGSAMEGQQQQVPGTQSVWVKTFGCSHNVSDSEYMAGQLADYGYR
jgi:hypothetical protein